jgi:RecA-family ATPase
MSKWIVKGLIPQGHIIMVLGQPGNGKSWWVDQLAIDAADGEHLHLNAYAVEKSHVLLIDEDTPTDVVEGRLERLAMPLGKKVSQLDIELRSMRGFFLRDDKMRTKLENDIQALKRAGKKSVLVVIDSLTKVMVGSNLDSTEKASKVMSYLTQLRNAGATVVIVHHMTTKRDVEGGNLAQIQGLAMGNTMLVSSCDTGIAVLRVPVEHQTLFTIIPIPRRVSLEVANPFAVELREDQTKPGHD